MATREEVVKLFAEICDGLAQRSLLEVERRSEEGGARISCASMDRLGWLGIFDEEDHPVELLWVRLRPLKKMLRLGTNLTGAMQQADQAIDVVLRDLGVQ